MKYRVLQLFIVIMLLSGSTKAQNLIAVQNGGTPAFYAKLDSAIVHAQNGDTIYLPGGIIYNGDLTINKSLHLIGTGINPDSAAAPLYTRFDGSISLLTDADGGSLEGIYSPNGTIIVNDAISNYHINRCLFYNLTLGATAFNNLFKENVILGNVNGNYAAGNSFYNNLIGGSLAYFSENNTFRNTSVAYKLVSVF